MKRYLIENFGKARSAFKKIATKSNWAIVLLSLSVLLGLYYDWSNMDIFFFALFIYSILNPVDSRRFATGGLMFLTLTPVLLFLNKTERAEEFAVYAFYLLSMSVIFAFVELKKEEKGE